MNWKPIARTLARWTVPPAIQELARRGFRRGSATGLPGGGKRRMLERNRRFLNRHTGQRCFVLATGPSIRELDLTPLKSECCIGVSEFYRHPQFRVIKPAYFAFAPNHPPFTDDDALRELAEMKQHSQGETFFFGLRDQAVVERSGLTDDAERVNYLHFDYSGYRPERIDLTGALPPPISAAVIGAWIAVYMGHAQVYLVGCDHDLLWKWDGIRPFVPESHYDHFYEGLPATGQNTGDLDGVLKNAMDIRDIVRWTSRVASRQGTRIFNANPRSRLDVVPRIPFVELFQGTTSRA